MAVRNATFGEIVRGQFHGDLVTSQNTDSITAEFTSEVGENGAVLIDFNAEETAWELFDDSASDFNTIFFAH